jgi:hypothetical protein
MQAVSTVGTISMLLDSISGFPSVVRATKLKRLLLALRVYVEKSN